LARSASEESHEWYPRRYFHNTFLADELGSIPYSKQYDDDGNEMSCKSGKEEEAAEETEKVEAEMDEGEREQ